jgi:hypothetical protein
VVRTGLGGSTAAAASEVRTALGGSTAAAASEVRTALGGSTAAASSVVRAGLGGSTAAPSGPAVAARLRHRRPGGRIRRAAGTTFTSRDTDAVDIKAKVVTRFHHGRLTIPHARRSCQRDRNLD